MNAANFTSLTLGHQRRNAAGDSPYLIGAVNFKLWPFSVRWDIPQTVVASQNIKERDLLYFQTYEAPKDDPVSGNYPGHKKHRLLQNSALIFLQKT